MGTEAERQDTRKAMAFDLFAIIDKDPAKETYTKEEMKKLFGIFQEIATVRSVLELESESETLHFIGKKAEGF